MKKTKLKNFQGVEWKQLKSQGVCQNFREINMVGFLQQYSLKKFMVTKIKIWSLNRSIWSLGMPDE